MAYSYTEYTASGSITTSTIYTAPPYLEGRGATDIKVTVDGQVKSQGLHYELASTAVTFNAGYLPTNGQTIRIARESSQATRLNDYADASLLTADTLDADANQLFFIAQEALDTASETNLAVSTFYSSGTSAPSSASAGDLFFNTSTGLLQIYTGSAWESVNNRGTKQTFAISGSTTVFTPSTPVDDNTLVFLNGVLLVKGAGSAGDYTTSSTQVTLNTAVTSGVVEIVTFPNATNGTFTSGINVTGTVTADGLTLDNDEKIIIGTGSAFQIYHSGNNSIISEGGSGDLLLRGNNLKLQKGDGGENYLVATSNGSVAIKHDNDTKLETSSSGVTVTGTVTTDALDINGTVDIDTGNTVFDVNTGSNNAVFTSSNQGRQFQVICTSTLDSACPDLVLRKANDTTGDDEFYSGNIRFENAHNDGYNQHAYATITSYIVDQGASETDRTDADAQIRFAVMDGNDSSTALKDPVEKLKIYKDGVLVTGTVTASSDIEVTDNTKGVILKSPNGSRFRLEVANDGTLSTEAL